MALDRFVYFRRAKKPTKKELRLVLDDFFGGATTEIKWDRDRFFVTLVGRHTNALRRMEDVPDFVRREPDPGFEGRHLEVWIGSDCIDVMTRQADEFTNALAEGFAKLVARFWHGDLEQG